MPLHELRRGRLPPRDQGHRQDVEQGADAQRQLQRQGARSVRFDGPLRVRRARRVVVQRHGAPHDRASRLAPFGDRARLASCCRRRGRAGSAGARRVEPVVRVAAVAAGSIYGVGARRERARRSTARSSRRSAAPPPSRSPTGPGSTGSRSCRPGPYVVRAHREGFCRRPQHARQRASASRARRRRSPCAAPTTARRRCWPPASASRRPRRRRRRATRAKLAWRLRRLTRSVLKDDDRRASTRPDADDDWFLEDSLEFLGRAVESSARLAVGAVHRLPALRPGQPAHGHAPTTTPATSSPSAGLGRGVLLGRRAGRPAWRLGGARRHEQRRRHVVDDGRRLRHAGARPRQSHHARHDLQPAALSRAATSRRCRPCPTAIARWRRCRRRTSSTLTPALDARLRRALRALRLPRRLRPRQPVGAASRSRRCRRCACTPRRRGSSWRRARKSSCRRPTRSGCRRSARSRRSAPTVLDRARAALRSRRDAPVRAASSVGVRALPPARRRSARHRVRRRGSRRGSSPPAATTAWPRPATPRLQGWAVGVAHALVAARARQRRLRARRRPNGTRRRRRSRGARRRRRRARCASRTSGCTT